MAGDKVNVREVVDDFSRRRHTRELRSFLTPPQAWMEKHRDCITGVDGEASGLHHRSGWRGIVTASLEWTVKHRDCITVVDGQASGLLYRSG